MTLGPLHDWSWLRFYQHFDIFSYSPSCAKSGCFPLLRPFGSRCSVNFLFQVFHGERKEARTAAQHGRPECAAQSLHQPWKLAAMGGCSFRVPGALEPVVSSYNQGQWFSMLVCYSVSNDRNDEDKDIEKNLKWYESSILEYYRTMSNVYHMHTKR